MGKPRFAVGVQNSFKKSSADALRLELSRNSDQNRTCKNDDMSRDIKLYPIIVS